MKKITENISFNLNLINSRIDKIEENILRLEEKLESTINLYRNHLIRLKNNEDINDDFILHGRRYRDLSPEKAFELYSYNDLNYILVDVSSPMFNKPGEFPEAVDMPLEDIKKRHKYELNKVTPIMVISENGTRSILACEILAELGYYNVNNISGGYKFWPTFRKEKLSLSRAA